MASSPIASSFKEMSPSTIRRQIIGQGDQKIEAKGKSAPLRGASLKKLDSLNQEDEFELAEISRRKSSPLAVPHATPSQIIVEEEKSSDEVFTHNRVHNSPEISKSSSLQHTNVETKAPVPTSAKSSTSVNGTHAELPKGGRKLSLMLPDGNGPAFSPRNLYRRRSQSGESDTSAHRGAKEDAEKGGDEVEQLNKFRRVSKRAMKVLDGKIVTIVTTVATIFALFGDDIKLASLPKAADPYFEYTSLVCLILFFAELILLCIFKEGYVRMTRIGSFFFWLDLVAVLSLVPDIPFMWDPILLLFSGGSDDSGDVSAEALTFARAGRAARAGTRAGRIVRMVRIIRMVRFVNVVKKIRQNRKKNQDQEEKPEVKADEEYEPSQIFRRLSDMISKKIILGVLLMLLVVPLLEVETVDYGPSVGVEMLNILASKEIIDNSLGFQADANVAFLSSSMAEYIAEYRQQSQDGVLIALNLSNNFVVSDDSVCSPIPSCLFSLFRQSELDLASSASNVTLSSGAILTGVSSTAYWNVKSISIQSALYSIFLTIFILVLLGVGAALFSRDTNRLVVRPIERMTKLVRGLAENPLATLRESERQKRRRKQAKGTEVGLIESALIKIGRLLQIGLGEAGSAVIAKNMMDESGELNPVIPGQRIDAIFGFCDIRQFTDTTECLQEEVMVFVNKVASVVHAATNKYGGSPNKNIGDAFLLAWKLGKNVDDDYMSSSRRSSIADGTGVISPLSVASPKSVASVMERSERDQMLADGSLIAFLEIIKGINTDEDLLAYSDNEAIKKRFTSYKLRMGFGLHKGWAIEGAIGSTLKVDASYLSPHVNLSARLEAATKQYGVELLMSDDLVALLSPRLRCRCRKLDRVTVKGSNQPMVLFTYDIFGPPNADDEVSFEKTDDPKKLLAIYGHMLDPAPHDLQRYKELYESGVEAYIDGDWKVAQEVFEKCLQMWPNDRPAEYLLEYMRDLRFEAGPDWQGFRELTEK